VAAIGAAGVWVIAWRLGGVATPQPTAAPSSAETAAAPPSAAATGIVETTPAIPPAPTASNPVLVRLRVASEPDGASVAEDGLEICSATPCDIVYKGSDADPAREHHLTLKRAGYRTELLDVKGSDSPITVKLVPLARRAVVPPPPQPRSPPASAGSVEIPY
jgi:hypothetical protein